MPKSKAKSTTKLSTDIQQELVLMRMSIKAIRDRTNEDLDAMVDFINRLLPQEETDEQRRFKNFTSKDWGDFLDGKIR